MDAEGGIMVPNHIYVCQGSRCVQSNNVDRHSCGVKVKIHSMKVSGNLAVRCDESKDSRRVSKGGY